MTNQITVSELEAACAAVAAAREKYDAASEVKKRAEAEKDKAELKVLEILKALDKTSYDSKIGKVGISHRLSVKLPATLEEKAAFFEYLQKMGVYDAMVSVNSQTLNKFYKDEFEKAKDRGDFDFAIPGIGEPTMSEIFSLKKS